MSKRRAIILSVIVEGRTQADVAREFGVSEATVSRWVARYLTDGVAAFEPRSRRPKRFPTRVPEQVIALIIDLRRTLSSEGLDAGPATIKWHLEQHHNVTVSTSTIHRHLITAGMVTPNPKKRPRSSLTRFQADLPNECWQTDMTHVQLASGADREVLTWIDDHSRYALSITESTRRSLSTHSMEPLKTMGSQRRSCPITPCTSPPDSHAAVTADRTGSNNTSPLSA